MVDIGEQTGRLDEVMDSLSSHYRQEENIQKSIRSAVAYPLIMITMMIAVILVLITKVMPIFNQVFAQLGQEMTGFSKGLLGLGTAINRYSIVLIVLLVLIIALFLFFTKTQKGEVAFRRFIYPIPFFRNIYDKTASCRFAGVMSLALRSGLNPDYAAELAAGLIDNEAFQKKLEECQKLVSEGTDFSAALTETGIFSGIYGRMTSLAASTGTSRNFILSVLLFLGLFLCFTLGINWMSREASQTELDILKQAIQRSVVHCYAAEGQYSESLAYLEERYGLRYDKEKYFIGYEVLGENIMPDITIIPRDASQIRKGR